jgi:glycosyltransferase involved in cell wall biosynthesis
MSENLSRNDTQALVRVFVPTCRRHHLLPRALDSLRAQTFSDWVCEVHNDDPSDNFPKRLVKALDDSRIELHDHERNLGALATFNLFYRATREPFYSLLEDDNWWLPDFLQNMISAMAAYPSVILAWCNQQVWEEMPDGSWRDTGNLVNPAEQTGPRLAYFGDANQIMGARYGQGAMLMRSQAGQAYPTPVDWPLAAVEPLRERMMIHPLLYVPRPSAVFAKTRQTARSENRSEWAIAQTILAATFFKHSQYGRERISEIFADARAKRKTPTTNILLFAALIEPKCRDLLRYSTLGDWFLLLRGLLRRPNVLWEVLRSRRRHKDWWRLLDRYTAARFDEMRSQVAVNQPTQKIVNC